MDKLAAVGNVCIWGRAAAGIQQQLASYLLVEVSACLQLPEKKVSKATTCS